MGSTAWRVGSPLQGEWKDRLDTTRFTGLNSLLCSCSILHGLVPSPTVKPFTHLRACMLFAPSFNNSFNNSQSYGPFVSQYSCLWASAPNFNASLFTKPWISIPWLNPAVEKLSPQTLWSLDIRNPGSGPAGWDLAAGRVACGCHPPSAGTLLGTHRAGCLPVLE